jgi:hypothetical protein
MIVDKHPNFRPASGESWGIDLTTSGSPGNNHRGAIFLPIPHGDDDD